MPEFHEGDKVRIIEPAPQNLIGLEGVITEFRETVGSSSGPDMPRPGTQFLYTVQIDDREHLRDIRQLWLEAI